MTNALRYVARSDVGLIRTNNQDSAYAGPRLLALADGMGGQAAGDIASAITIASLAHLDEEDPGSDPLAPLLDAVDDANGELGDLIAHDISLQGMGTTLTAMLWSGLRFAIVHIGDSRGYLLRDGKLQQITHDHSFVQSLVDAGKISPEEVKTHPQRALILKAIDGHEGLDPDTSIREARPGDRYLLCSDGLSSVVSFETLAEVLSSDRSPEETADLLVDLALRGGGPDNVTLVLADVVDIEDASRDAVIVGAAASSQTRRSVGIHSSAGRAMAALRRSAPGDDDLDLEPESEPDHEHRPGFMRRHRGFFVFLLVIVLLAGGAGGLWAWTRTQYYVGVSGGQVAVFQGIPGSIAGFHSTTLLKQTDLQVATLPDYEQERLESGITCSSLTAADEIVGRLGQEARDQQPTPTVSPSPSPPASQPATPHPSQSVHPGQSAHPSAHPTSTTPITHASRSVGP